MAGSLFLRSLERSDRIYNAMLSRGYDGEVRTLPQPAISRGEWVTLWIGLAVLSSLLALSYWLR
jgi:cobalt/nickel transport system permease protein